MTPDTIMNAERDADESATTQTQQRHELHACRVSNAV